MDLIFIKDITGGRGFLMTGKDDENQQHMTTRGSELYSVAHDISRQLIFERVKQDSSASKRYTATISRLETPDEEDQYFLTSIYESASFIGCNCEKKWCRYPDCGETIIYLNYEYEFIGNTLEAAVLKYQDFTGRFGGLR
jgi:hypothetical protein